MYTRMEVTGVSDILNLVENYKSAMVIRAACQLRLFDFLSSIDATSVDDLAKAVECDAHALERLLNALAAMGIVVKEITNETHKFKNSEVAARQLVSNHMNSLWGLIQFSLGLESKFFQSLPLVVKTGQTQRHSILGGDSAEIFHATNLRSDDMSSTLIRGMHSYGCISAERMVQFFDLSPYKHAVDAGGCSGAVAEQLSKAYPNMEATIFDLPWVIQKVKQMRIPDGRVHYVAGDFFDVSSMPHGDLYVLGHILHDWDTDKINTLLNNIKQRIFKGGAILIFEKFLSENMVGPVHGNNMDLLMLAAKDGARERTCQQYQKLLLQHGFVDIQIHRDQDGINYYDGMLASVK